MSFDVIGITKLDSSRLFSLSVFPVETKSTIVEHINAKAMVHGFIRFRDKSPVADKYFWLVCKKINEFLEMKD